jgi:uncharacterized membrane protein
MSDSVVLTYPDEYKAAEVLAALQRLQEKLLIDMEDAAYVVSEKMERSSCTRRSR